MSKYSRQKKEFTENETIVLMLKDSVLALRSIADFAEKWKLEADELIEFMREVADENEAQISVVELRDEIGFKSAFKPQ